MSVLLQGRPRAYVAAPVAPANGLFQVINWAFHQAEDLTWGDLGILVTDLAMITQQNHLQRLKSRGVRIGTPKQAARARSFHGVVIAYCPDRTMLTIAESLTNARAVAIIALDNDQLVQWVADWTPQHLGGDVLPVSPLAVTRAPARPVPPSQVHP